MKIKFCGAAEEVTGSCYLIETKKKRILVDCGMFQGGRFCNKKNYEEFAFDPKEIDLVLLTHAHQDHCGRLPRLFKKGFTGKILTTSATVDLAQVVLFDSANILVEESRRLGLPALYDDKDVRGILKNFSKIKYNHKVEVLPGIEVCFREAGHILGAAIIEFWSEGKKIVFSGDLGYQPVLLIKPTKKIKDADFVVCESTYGDRLHHLEDKQKVIFEAAEEIERKKAVLMIPAFALERTQEILLELNNLVENEEIDVFNVFVDSPLAIKITEVFRRHRDCYNKQTQEQLKTDQIFRFPGLKYTVEVSQSKFINRSPKPKVVIAGSGMCNGGRILHHFRHHLSNNDNLVLIVGYQVKGTLGQKLISGAESITIHGEKVRVRAQIRKTDAFSGHADQKQLISWLANFSKDRLSKLFLTHGDKEVIPNFKKKIEEELKIKATIPRFGEEFQL